MASSEGTQFLIATLGFLGAFLGLLLVAMVLWVQEVIAAQGKWLAFATIAVFVLIFASGSALAGWALKGVESPGSTDSALLLRLTWAWVASVFVVVGLVVGRALLKVGTGK